MKEKIVPLNIKTRSELYSFLKKNYKNLNEYYLIVKTGDPNSIKGLLSYIDAVEVALCFGYIDSIKRSEKGNLIQKFSKRTKLSPWTELNKERVRRLIKRKEMTEEGLNACPDLNKEFEIPKYLKTKLDKYPEESKFFFSCPDLYQRIRIYNLDFYHNLSKEEFNKSFKNFIKNCKEKKMYGLWNDYGRLLNY